MAWFRESPSDLSVPGSWNSAATCARARELTGLLDQSALYGVLAETEAPSLDLLEVRQLEPPAQNHRNQVTAAHHDDR